MREREGERERERNRERDCDALAKRKLQAPFQRLGHTQLKVLNGLLFPTALRFPRMTE